MILPLLLALSIPPTPLPQVKVRPVIDLARVTVETAEKLAGREILAEVLLDVDAWSHDGWQVYGTFSRVGLANAAAAPVERSVWMREESDHHALILRGRVSVIRHPTTTISGHMFEGFTEIRFIARPH